MLLDDKKKSVEQAWLQRESKKARLDAITQKCNAECRAYFTRPRSLVWPFAAGILLTRFKGAAPAALEATSLALSAFKVVSKASPIIKRFLT